MDAGGFDAAHDGAYAQQNGQGPSPGDTPECLADMDVSKSGQVATVGPLAFVANATSGSCNWVPDETEGQIGVCKASSTGAAAGACAAPLFAVVDINDVTLEEGETLIVTYTLDMAGPCS